MIASEASRGSETWWEVAAHSLSSCVTLLATLSGFQTFNSQILLVGSSP